MARQEKQPYNDFWIFTGQRKQSWHYYGGIYCEEFINFKRVDTYEVDKDRYNNAYKKAR